MTWIGDHLPRHIHVFKNGSLVLKWDLDNRRVIEGKANKRIQKVINELEAEGKI